MNYPAYVITIEDNPSSQEAAQSCVDSGKKYGLMIQKMWATTPAHDWEKEVDKYEISTDAFYDQWSRPHNAICCFLSHARLWKHSVDHQTPLYVFEHDAVMVDQMPTIVVPPKALITFGAPSYGAFNTPPSLGINPLTSKPYVPGMHGYLVTPLAAQEMLDKAKTQACPADVYAHRDRFDFIYEYYPWPVEARDTFTTVQAYMGVQAKHSYRKNKQQYEIIDP